MEFDVEKDRGIIFEDLKKKIIFLLIFISRGFERNGKSKNVLEFDVEKERVIILKKKNSLKKIIPFMLQSSFVILPNLLI